MIEISKKVYIRRKPQMSSFFTINTKTLSKSEQYWKIGSALTSGGGILKGLSAEEEKLYLPSIISIDSGDLNMFRRACNDYWNNISVNIPENPGLELEIGFVYPDKETADKAEKEAQTNPTARQNYGTPINIEQYVFYRYCLVYNRVAAKVEDVEKSNKIRFYIYSKEAELANNYSNYENKKKAIIASLELLSDRNKLKSVLYIMNKFDITDEREQDIIIDEFASTKPVEFLNIVQDTKLNDKAFIQKCIAKGLLTVQPNTEVILVEPTDILGINLNDAVANLATEKREGLRIRLKAQLKMPIEGEGKVETTPSAEDMLKLANIKAKEQQKPLSITKPVPITKPS